MNETKVAPVASPCIGRCQLDTASVCIGCFRTGFEIGRWLSASEEERGAIVAAARRRRSTDSTNENNVGID